MKIDTRKEKGLSSGKKPKLVRKRGNFFSNLISSLNRGVDGLRSPSRKIFNPLVLFLLILCIGIFARVWEFQQLPPGLNQDEASIGVEAYNLLHFGVDRYGMSYPVNFISWGTGQNALYAYLLLPFIALGGLTPFTVRLPMLISGILTLPLVYFVAKRTLNKSYALLAMFLLAICPWHIMLSRWGLESNILPFIFLLGYVFLLKSTSTNKWFILSCLFFALCLYAYGTAYVAIPVFMLIIILTTTLFKKVDRKILILGIVIFILFALPIGLFVLVNSMHLGSIQLGPFTIPRYPRQARYERMSVGFNNKGLSTLVQNLQTFLSLLISQNDGLIWNSIKPFGYFYGFTFPLAIIGVIQFLLRRDPDSRSERILLLGWLAVCLLIGALQEVNINRINLIFIPLILCMAVPLEWLWNHLKVAGIFIVLLLLIGFSFFTYQYHSATYRQQTDGPFFTGLLPALNFARQEGDYPICITDHINQPYIFVLFSERMDQKLYADTIQLMNPDDSRAVLKLGRYSFGMSNCPNDPYTIYVLSGEQPPENGIQFKVSSFVNYQVFIPEAIS